RARRRTSRRRHDRLRCAPGGCSRSGAVLRCRSRSSPYASLACAAATSPCTGAPHILNGGRAVNRPLGARALFLAEAGWEVGREVVLGVDRARLGEELLLRLGIVGVRHAAVDRTHRRALLLIEKPDALRALLGDDVIDVLLQGGMALPLVLPGDPAFVDGRVRALGLTGPAVDALGSDHRRHGVTRASVGTITASPAGRQPARPLARARPGPRPPAPRGRRTAGSPGARAGQPPAGARHRRPRAGRARAGCAPAGARRSGPRAPRPRPGRRSDPPSRSAGRGSRSCSPPRPARACSPARTSPYPGPRRGGPRPAAWSP